jgi:short-subunit dehydrogenase
MRRFEGKTVVITGASTGIGESCARKFVKEGARVVLAARSKPALDALSAELGPEVTQPMPTDISDVGQCKRLIQEAQSRFGRIDVLVNNAGKNTRGEFEKIPLDDILGILDVNLRAPLVLSRLALPIMRAQGFGTIVNVASLAGRFPLDDEATYSAAKFGLRIFSFAVAEELRGTNVRVAVVSPGPVDTGFITDPAVIDTVPALVFSQPMSTADEIADLVLQSALDGARERTKPALSGRLATLSYLVPEVRRALLPVFERKGVREKKKYIERNRR